MIPEASCMRFNKAKCPVLQSTRVRGNGLKLFQGRFRTDIRKKKTNNTFTEKTIRHWKKAAQGSGENTILEAFKRGVDVALGDVV